MLSKSEGYSGHSVVITGYEPKFILINDPGLLEGLGLSFRFPRKHVSDELFERAMDGFLFGYGSIVDYVKRSK